MAYTSQLKLYTNKYRRWHDAIIDRASCRTKRKGFERHHIIPKSFGGSNDATNLVLLSYREHFLIHWLLIKITTGTPKRKMMNALSQMTRRGKDARVVSSWQYDLGKRAVIEAMTGRRLSKRTKKKMSLRRIGTKLSVVTRARMSASRIGNTNTKGKKHSEQTKQKMSITRKGRSFRPPFKHSEETRRKISESLIGNSRTLGRKLSADHIAKLVKGRRESLEKKRNG